MIFGTFFTISGENVGTMLGYVRDLITDFTPLLLPIIAVGVGLFVVLAIIRAIVGR